MFDCLIDNNKFYNNKFYNNKFSKIKQLFSYNSFFFDLYYFK